MSRPNEDGGELRPLTRPAVKCLPRRRVPGRWPPPRRRLPGRPPTRKAATRRRGNSGAANVIARRTHRLWKNLYDCMQKTYATLEDRKRQIGGNETLETQNKELRALLSQYMSAGSTTALYPGSDAPAPARVKTWPLRRPK